MAKPLSERISSAQSTDRVTITDLEQLIAEATAERNLLSAAAVAASSASVDFRFTDDERDESARQAERHTRTATALDGAITDLTAKLRAKQESETQKAKAAQVAEILADRDALAARLSSEWPAMEAGLIDLLLAIQASDERMRRAGVREAGAEQLARGLRPEQMNGTGGNMRLADLRLPSFTEPGRHAWPQPQVRYDFGAEIRRDRLAAQKRKETEEARWQRWLVTPPAKGKDGPPILRTRYRDVLLARAEILVLSEEMVKAAEAAGCTVEPTKAGEALGLPSSAAYF